MKIEAIRKAGDGNYRLEHMVAADPGIHDLYVAHTLGTAAAWSYADVDTFSRIIDRKTIGAHEAVSLAVSNPALLVGSTVYVVQSLDQRLLMICFRGTEPTNPINWVGDMTTAVDQFLSVGSVHSGFYRATMALWDPLRNLLVAGQNGSICEEAVKEKLKFADFVDESTRAACRPPVAPAPASSQLGPLEALYITGHSLGGALAIIFAALMYADPELAFLRN